MFTIPLSDIIARIKEKTTFSDAEIKKKIDEKMESLSGLVSEEGAAHIVANELGIKLFDPNVKLKIKNVLSGMRSVELSAKVLKRYETKQFSSNGRNGQLASVLLGDETGVIRAVFWNKGVDNIAGVKEGDIIKIGNAYVKDNQGRKELHLNDQSKIIINPAGETIEVQAQGAGAVRKQLKDITENDSSVEVLGTIVQVFEPRYFEVCPSCKKRTKLKDDVYICPSHGAIIPDYSYLVNVYLDDGSLNMRTVFFRDQVQKLLEVNDSQMLYYRENMHEFEPLKNNLLGTMIKAQCRVNKNAVFDRLELVANTVEINPDPMKEMAQIKEKEQLAVPEKKKDEERPSAYAPKPIKPEPVKQEGTFEDLDLEELDNIDEEFL
jgi:hypothetical protein